MNRQKHRLKNLQEEELVNALEDDGKINIIAPGQVKNVDGQKRGRTFINSDRV